MQVVGMKTRKISFHRGKKRPYHASILAAGRFIYLGYYRTREDAEIACKAARKAVPALPAGRPRIGEEKRAAILETYRQVKSQTKTAQAHGVSEKPYSACGTRQGQP
jgi:hypothetical protein